MMEVQRCGKAEPAARKEYGTADKIPFSEKPVILKVFLRKRVDKFNEY